MRTLFFDCFSGISGDMTIGALLDLGIDRHEFLEKLSGLNIDGYRVEINEKLVNGIRGTDVDVILDDEEQVHDHVQGHMHEGEHDHIEGHDHGQSNNHDHCHEYDHSHAHTHGHGERGIREIFEILDNSSLSRNCIDLSKRIFLEIAAAEARVHVNQLIRCISMRWAQ